MKRKGQSNQIRMIWGGCLGVILLPGVEEPDAQKALFWGDASLTKETGKSVFDPISLVTLPPRT